MDRKLIDYLPQPHAELRELRLLMAAEDPEIDLLWAAYDRVLNSAYVEIADESGIERYEKMFGVMPEEKDTLEERRAYIYTIVSTVMPYTYPWLVALLTDMYGEKNIDISLDANSYKLSINLKIGSKLFSRIVRELTKKAIPANLVVEIILDFNRWENFKNRTWGELYTKKWYEVKEAKDE
jgi:hypothetical protein